ncbi:hypothetical protein [Aliiroseovarius sp.]|uniref:hypothetical protein n=1 Tax=Aliiroseovarius sp. TaxID=1872442 RepID=UPI003BAA16C1
MRLERPCLALLLLSLLPAQGAPHVPDAPSCLDPTRAAALTPGAQEPRPIGLWPHDEGRVVGFAFGPVTSATSAPREKLFLFLLDNGACFTRAVLFDHRNGETTARLFTPERSRSLVGMALPPDLNTALHLAAEALQ